MKRAKVIMIKLAEYRGWSIEQNPHGCIVASKGCAAFPMICDSVEQARTAIDTREALQ